MADHDRQIEELERQIEASVERAREKVHRKRVGSKPTQPVAVEELAETSGRDPTEVRSA